MLPVELGLKILMVPVVDRPGVAQPEELGGPGLPDPRRTCETWSRRVGASARFFQLALSAS